jgi:hypothetical protein
MADSKGRQRGLRKGSVPKEGSGDHRQGERGGEGAPAGGRAARQVEAEMGSFYAGEEDAGYPPDFEDMAPK